MKHYQNKHTLKGTVSQGCLAMVQELLDTKLKLDEEIKVKVNSLRIDQQRCMATRRTFPYNIISTRYY